MNTFCVLTKEQLQEMSSEGVGVYLDRLYEFYREEQRIAMDVYLETYEAERTASGIHNGTRDWVVSN